MTDIVNPSPDRPTDPFLTAGSIAYAGSSGAGWVARADEATELATESAISEGNLNAFFESHSSSSFDVTIDPGEAFIFGSWVATDNTTTVTLASSTNNQTVYVGWNRDASEDVIVGLDSAFSTTTGNVDQRIPLWEFDTDGSGVTAVRDRRRMGQTVYGSTLVETTSVSSDYTTAGEEIVFVDSSSGSVTVTLSTVDTESGRSVQVIDLAGSAGTNSIIVGTENSETIDGNSTFTLDRNFLSAKFACDGSNWYTSEVQGLSQEQVQDIVGNFISGGTNISTTYDDANDTLTIDTSALDAEEVDDRVNNLLTGGTNITVSYDDTGDTLTIDADQLNEEQVEDIVAGLLVGGDKMSFTYDDGSDTLTVDTSALDTEEVQDTVNNLLSPGDNVVLNYDDANDSLTIQSPTVDGADGAQHTAGSFPEFGDTSTGDSNTSQGDAYVVNEADGYHLYLNE